MANEITLKDLYDIIDKRCLGIEMKVEKYHDAFVKFEEGKLTTALQDIEKAKGEINVLKEKLARAEGKEEKNKSQIKVWVWGALEKLLFISLGFAFSVLGLVLTKLGIINLR